MFHSLLLFSNPAQCVTNAPLLFHTHADFIQRFRNITFRRLRLSDATLGRCSTPVIVCAGKTASSNDVFVLVCILPSHRRYHPACVVTTGGRGYGPAAGCHSHPSQSLSFFVGRRLISAVGGQIAPTHVARFDDGESKQVQNIRYGSLLKVFKSECENADEINLMWPTNWK